MSRSMIVGSLLVLSAAAAEAQTVEPPPRVARPSRVEGSGSGRSLQFDTSIYGGYDRNLLSSNVQPIDATFDPSTFRGWGSASLKYSLTSGQRSFDLGGGGTANTINRASPIRSGPVYGTNANIGFRTPLRGTTTFTLLTTATRTPFYSMGIFGALPPGSYSPDSNPVNGIVDGHVWYLNSSATVGRPLGRRTTTGLSYSYQRSLYEGGRSDMANEQHSAVVNLDQRIAQTIQIQSSYHVASRRATQAGVHYDGVSQGFSLGLRKSQPIGPSRTLAMSVGGGAELVDSTGPNQYWQPTYNARLDIDISRSWVVSAHYTQTSAMLYSPLSAPDSYLTRSAVISVGGYLSRNVDLTVNTGGSRGGIAAINSVTGFDGRYFGVNSSVQLRVLLTGGWSAVVSTNYYQSDLNGAAKQFLTTPGNFRRSSVRAGFTWNVPLLESAQTRRPPRGRRS